MHRIISVKVGAGIFVVFAGVLGAFFIIGIRGEEYARPSITNVKDYRIDAEKIRGKGPFIERIASAGAGIFNALPVKTEERNFTQEFAGFVSGDLLAKNPETLTGLDISFVTSLFSQEDFSAATQSSITERDLRIIDDQSISAFKAYRETLNELMETYAQQLGDIESPSSLLGQEMNPAILARLADTYEDFIADALTIPVPRDWAPVLLEEVLFLDAKRSAYRTAAVEFQSDPIAVALAFQFVEQRSAEFAEAERLLDERLKTIQLGRLAELEEILTTQFENIP